jgi:hypothetical protein
MESGGADALVYRKTLEKWARATLVALERAAEKADRG